MGLLERGRAEYEDKRAKQPAKPRPLSESERTAETIRSMTEAFWAAFYPDEVVKPNLQGVKLKTHDNYVTIWHFRCDGLRFEGIPSFVAARSTQLSWIFCLRRRFDTSVIVRNPADVWGVAEGLSSPD
jgi:hypothetical protein